MSSIHNHAIPIELLEVLNRINDNLHEVKERLARLEALDHSDSIKLIRADIDKERNARIALQIELASVKTKLAPITVGISMVAAVLIQAIINNIPF